MKQKIYGSLSLLLVALYAAAQSPTHYPPIESEPVQFNFVRILLYIVLPVALLVVYIYLRRKQKKEKEEEK